MKEKFNYTTADISKRINELGIHWKASAYWQLMAKPNVYELKDRLDPFREGFAAYNMTELGLIIPFGFFNVMKVQKYLNGYFKVQLCDGKWETYTTEVEARGRYLIDLIESKNIVIEGKEVKPPEEIVKVSKSHPVPEKK